MTFTFKLARRLAQSHLLPLGSLVIFAGSCAPGKPLEGGLEPPPADVLALHIFPDSVSLNPSEFVDYTAIAELSDGGTAQVGVSWSATGGSITANGRFTAGGTAGSYSVVGRYQNGLEATSQVEVLAPPPPPELSAIAVNPSTAALLPGASQTFAATGILSDGSTSTVSVTWSASAGTITSGGQYTAPSVAGSYQVVATVQGGTLADTAVVTVDQPPPTLTAVELTPPSTALEYGRTQQFTAVGRLNDGSTATIPITWSATGGTVNGTGLYTAGSTAGNFRVIARSANGLADTSSVAITAPTITVISVTPATASLQSGQTRQFTATATLSNGTTQNNPAVTWIATGGTINGSGLYTAGATAGNFRVIATSGNGHADTSTVTVSLPTVVSINLTPASVTLNSGQTRQFAVTATLSNGVTENNPAVTWSSTGGTVSTGGLYTAGANPGSFRVIVLSPSGPADTSAITILPAVVAINVTPTSVTLSGGQSQQFTASATLSDGSSQASPSVTWSATGGTITTGGRYTAGSTAGAFRVIAMQQGGTLADTSAITVTPSAPPVLQAVVLTPSAVSLVTGGTQQFSVRGVWSDGSSTAPAVTYSATGGTVSVDGLYTAGSTTGTFRLIATQQGGTLADTSTITLSAPGSYLPPDILSWNFEDGVSPSTPFGTSIPVVAGDAATTDENYSAYSNWPNGSGSEVSPGWIFYGQDHGGSNRTDVWIRFAVKFYNNYTGSGATGQKINRIYDASGSGYVSSLGRAGGGGGFIYDFGSTSFQPNLSNIPAPGSSGFAYGTWHWFELHFRRSGSHWMVDIYFDGEPNPRHSFTDPASSSGGFGGYYEVFTTLNGPFNGPYAFKVDDVAYSSTRIGIPTTAKIGAP